MDISMNLVNKANPLSAWQAEVAQEAEIEDTASSQLLHNLSLTVSEGALLPEGALDKLIALLVMESEGAREESMVGVLSNAYAVVEKMDADAAASDREALSEMSTLSDERFRLENEIEALKEDILKARAAVALATLACDRAVEALEAFDEQEGLDLTDPAVMERRAELVGAIDKAREKQAAALDASAALDQQLDAKEVALNEVSDALTGLYDELSDASRRALIDAVKISFGDLSDEMVSLLEEEEKPTSAKALSEMTMAELVQYITERQDEMRETIESKREQLV